MRTLRFLPATFILPSTFILAACLTASAKTAQDISCAALPSPVSTAAATYERKPGTEAECEKIDDSGKTFYEVKVTTAAGKMREIVFHPDGRLYELEDEGELADVPAAARMAIQKAVAKGELAKVDIIHRGKITLYEGEYREGGVKKKVIVDKTGKVVGPQASPAVHASVPPPSLKHAVGLSVPYGAQWSTRSWVHCPYSRPNPVTLSEVASSSPTEGARE